MLTINTNLVLPYLVPILIWSLGVLRVLRFITYGERYKGEIHVWVPAYIDLQLYSPAQTLSKHNKKMIDTCTCVINYLRMQYEPKIAGYIGAI